MAQTVWIDVTQPSALAQAFPHPPQVYAFQTQLHVADYQQPAFRTPDLCFSRHTVSIHLGSPVVKERVLAGRSQTETFFAGDISVTPAHQCRAVHLHQPAEFVHLYLDSALLAHAAPEADAIELIPQFKLRDSLIHSLGLALTAELRADAGDALYVESLLTALAAHLLRHYTNQRPLTPALSRGLTRAQLQRSIAYIQAHLEDVSLAGVAAELDLSSSYFCRLFKQATGVTPHQYVIQQRVDRAKQLLLQTPLSLSTIAHRVGFANQSHFTYHFKRLLKITPKQLRWQESGREDKNLKYSAADRPLL